ncbi:MAG: PQQ-like beta-propeller repeat protein, partial [Asgard group archaeon]|nr:PQQ-like beta-propeller repeat protein [Asgard group archaeon]
MIFTKIVDSRLIPNMGVSKVNSDLWNDELLLNPNVIGITKNWYIDVDEPIYSSPIIVDIDRDGSKDIIVGFGLFKANPGGMCCIENNGSIKWIYHLSSPALSSPAVADLDQDNSLDIIFTCVDNTTYCLNPDGTLKWIYDMGYTSIATPNIADIDGDGTFEIIVIGGVKLLGGIIACLNGNGTLRWSYPTPGWTHSSSVIADLNKDGKLEVLAAFSSTSDLFCLDYDGSLKWIKNFIVNSQGFGISGSPIVVDIDNDLEQEIIFGNTMGTVYCLNATGDQEWNYSSPTDDFFFTPVVSYIDSDPYLDIIIGSSIDDAGQYVSFIRCIDHEGKETWSVRDVSVSLSASTPLVADVNDDGNYEISFSSMNNNTYLIPNTGVPIISSYRTGAINPEGRDFPAIASSAAIDDIDNDGVLELIVGSDWLLKGRIWCIKITGTTSQGHTPYPCFRGSMFRTGSMDRDSDYIDDLTEGRSYSTSIYNPDTDDDGLLDGEEIWYNTNPLEEDSDSDGFTDGVEISSNKDPLDP